MMTHVRPRPQVAVRPVIIHCVLITAYHLVPTQARAATPYDQASLETSSEFLESSVNSVEGMVEVLDILEDAKSHELTPSPNPRRISLSGSIRLANYARRTHGLVLVAIITSVLLVLHCMRAVLTNGENGRLLAVPGSGKDESDVTSSGRFMEGASCRSMGLEEELDLSSNPESPVMTWSGGHLELLTEGSSQEENLDAVDAVSEVSSSYVGGANLSSSLDEKFNIEAAADDDTIDFIGSPSAYRLRGTDAETAVSNEYEYSCLIDSEARGNRNVEYSKRHSAHHPEGRDAVISIEEIPRLEQAFRGRSAWLALLTLVRFRWVWRAIRCVIRSLFA